MTRTTNYDNRRVSLNIYDTFNFSSDFQQKTRLGLGSFEGGKVCAGIVKLVQRVLTLLLTDFIPFDPEWRTNLAVQIRGNMPANANSLVAVSVYQVKQQMARVIREDTPDDERLADISIDDVSYNDNKTVLRISLSILSAAGETRDLVVPINLR